MQQQNNIRCHVAIFFFLINLILYNNEIKEHIKTVEEHTIPVKHTSTYASQQMPAILIIFFL